MQNAQLMLVRAEDEKLRIERQVQHLSVASIRLLFGVVTIEKSTHEYQHCVCSKQSRCGDDSLAWSVTLTLGRSVCLYYCIRLDEVDGNAFAVRF